MSEPKMFTEERVRDLHGLPQDALVSFFRAHGLIAPEPVDPVRLMAVQIMDYLNPQGDEQDINWIVNTILRPGIDALELAERKELTREMVREATGLALTREEGSFDDALHAALQERLK
jgi:hypothetical protein